MAVIVPVTYGRPTAPNWGVGRVSGPVGVPTRSRPARLLLGWVAALGVVSVLVAVPARVLADACTWPDVTFRWGGDVVPGTEDPDLAWENPANWDRGRVPTATDRVCVPAWPDGAPEVHGDAVGGVIDASGTTITLRSGTLTVTRSLAADTVVLDGGELRGPGDSGVGGGRDALDLVAEVRCEPARGSACR